LLDRIWEIILFPAIILGVLANKYARTKQIRNENEQFIYFRFELPEDKDCNDVPNKRKWLHKYRTGPSGLAKVINLGV
jgi:hypothetical protein